MILRDISNYVEILTRLLGVVDQYIGMINGRGTFVVYLKPHFIVDMWVSYKGPLN